MWHVTCDSLGNLLSKFHLPISSNLGLKVLLRGGLIQTFFLALVVIGAFCHDKPPYQPRGSFDSLNEALWCTDCPCPIYEKSVKTTKNTIFSEMQFFWDFSCFFQKWDFAKSWGYLRYNQCIKTLNLSYQTTHYNDFHCLPYNGGSLFSDPW